MGYTDNIQKTLKSYRNIAYSFIAEHLGNELTAKKASAISEKIAISIIEYEKTKK